MQRSLESVAVERPISWGFHTRNPRKSACTIHPMTTVGQQACIFSTQNRRLRPPEPLPPYGGHYNVHKFGSSCPQQRLVLPQGLNSQLEKDISNIVSSLYEDVTIDSEDCEAPSSHVADSC
jgi:hypothetical protein